MKHSKQHRHRDVEMSSSNNRQHSFRRAPKSVRDPIFEEDIEDFTRRRRPVWTRLVACLLGVVALVVAALGAYFFLQSDNIDLQKGPSRHANFQGTVLMETIMEHTVPEDCWLSIHGNVYDMTEYAPIHPGPDSLITRHCGKDATVAYDFEHSIALLPIVDQYLLGTLQAVVTPAPSQSPSSVPSMTPTTSSPTRNPTYNPTTSNPTVSPSATPTRNPTNRPTTPRPTEPEATPFPTIRPTTAPPTRMPTPPPTQTPPPTRPPTPGPTPPPTPPPTVAPQGCPMEFYTLADVAQHGNAASCWYILYGVVYDFTSYINRHPGGRGTALQGCGIDATTIYSREKKHTRQLLQKDGHASRIIGRYGTVRETGTVPCDEVNSVAVY